MKNSLVIIPTYNERENIELIIPAVLDQHPQIHVLIVDDNSPDGTGDVVERLRSTTEGNRGEVDELRFRESDTYPNHNKKRIHLLRRASKNGLGTAYIAGFKWALSQGYTYIFQMDADFSHNPADLPLLYEACVDKGADMAIGSRYVSGINVVNWPLGRVILSVGASKYVRMITGMKIYDPTAGFNCYHRKVLESIPLDDIRFVGYAFQIEMKYNAYAQGFKILEIPIVFTDRVRGKSKLSGGIISEAVFGVIKMKIKRIFK